MFTRHALIRRQDRILKQLQPRIHVTGAPEPGAMPEGEFAIPGGALVSEGHCWAALAEDGTAKVGLDDFARKAIGRIESIEFPDTGKKVNAGEPLFTVVQGQRRIAFQAPISGTVVMTNAQLTANAGAIEDFAYGENWVCVIEGDDLDAELGELKIGKAAVAYFQEEIGRFQEFLQNVGVPASEALKSGALGKLDDADWNKAANAFFAHG
jgi:glycine cleavage system H protein